MTASFFEAGEWQDSQELASMPVAARVADIGRVRRE